MQTDKKFLKESASSFLTTSEALEKFWDPKSRQIFALRYLVVGEILARLVVERKESLVLDAGCGGGFILNFLPKLSRDAVYLGLDISLRNVQRARSKWAELKTFPEAHFLVADVENLPLKGSFVDVVVSIEVLEHLLDPRSGLREMSRVLRQNGKIVLTTPSAFKLSGRSVLSAVRDAVFAQVEKPPKQRETTLKTSVDIMIPHRDFTRFELGNILKNHFQIISIFSLTFNRVYVVLKKFLPQKAMGKVFYVDKALRRVPVLRVLGDYWLVIGEK